VSVGCCFLGIQQLQITQLCCVSR